MWSYMLHAHLRDAGGDPVESLLLARRFAMSFGELALGLFQAHATAVVAATFMHRFLATSQLLVNLEASVFVKVFVVSHYQSRCVMSASSFLSDMSFRLRTWISVV